MSDYTSTKVHLPPMMMIMDVIGVLFLVVGVHDWLRPGDPWVALEYQFPGYIWVLLGGGATLMVLTLISVIKSFSGKGTLSAEDF